MFSNITLIYPSVNVNFTSAASHRGMIEIDLIPFNEWTPRPTADARRASPAQFLHGFTDILAAQGPMQALHLFQTYAKAGGLLKITKSVRSQIERTLLGLETSGDLLIEREDDSETDGPEDSRGWIVRLPDQPRVMMRTLGPRGFSEIPLGELAALTLEIKCADEFLGREDITRLVLSHYGLQKLTALVGRRMERVFKTYF